MQQVSSSPDPFAVIQTPAQDEVLGEDIDALLAAGVAQGEEEAAAQAPAPVQAPAAGQAPIQASLDVTQNPGDQASLSVTQTDADTDPDDGDGGVLDTLGDIGEGIVAGAANTVDNTIQTGALLANALGADIDVKEDLFQFDVEEPDSLAGKLTEGIVRFGLGFVGVGKFLKVAQFGLTKGGAAGQAAARFLAGGNTGVQIGKSALQGAAGDFIVSDAFEGRLADLVEKNSILEIPIVKFLASNEEDSIAEGKFKAAVEGFVLGGVADGLFIIVKGLKASRLAKATGKAQVEVDEALLKAALDAEEFFGTPNAVKIDPTTGAAGKVPVTKAGKVPINKRLIDAPTLKALRAAVVKAADDGGAEFDAVANNIPFNTETFKVGETLLQTMDDLSKVLAKRTDDGVERLNDVDALAVALAQDPAKLLDDLHFDAEVVEELGARIAAAKYVMHSLGNATIEAATQMEVLAKVGKLTPDLVERWNRTALMWAEFHITGKKVIRGVARAEGAGRIRTGAGIDIDPDNLLKTLSEIQGDPLVAIRKIALMNSPGLVARAFKLMFKNKAWDIHNELLVNGMLSGVKTFEINFFSTGLNTFIVRPLERGVGAAIEGGARAGISEVSALYSGMFRGFRDSIKMSAKAFRKEEAILDPLQGTSEIRKAISVGDSKVSFDKFREFGGIGGMMANGVNATGQVVRLPTRLLLTADEFFKQSAYRMDISAQLSREAAEQGLDGKGISRFIETNFEKRILEGLDPKTGKAKNLEALDFARDVSFTQDLDRFIPPGGRQTAGGGVQNFVAEHPGFRFIAPFIRTPVNLMRFVWQRTPGIGQFQHQMKADIAAGGRRAAQAKAKIASGYTLYSMGTLMAAGGYITGSGPKDPALKAQWEKDGKTPYAVRRHFPDGTSGWTQINRLDPVAMPMFLIADLMQAASDPSVEKGQIEEFAVGIFIALAKNLNSKGYLKGITDLMDTVASEEEWKWARFLGQQGQIRIPFNGLLRNLNPDETLREARTVLDSMLNGLPGFSESLPAKRDALGETRLRVSSQSFTPFPSTEDSNNVLDKELAKLADQGQKIGVPNRTQKGVNLDEFPGFFEEWQKLISTMKVGRGPNAKTMRQRLETLVSSKKYKALDQNVTQADGTPLTVSLIRAEIADFREEAFDRLVHNKETSSKFKNEDGVTLAKAVENAAILSDGLSSGRSIEDVKSLFNF